MCWRRPSRASSYWFTNTPGFTALQQFVRTAAIEPTAFNGVTVSPLIEWGRLIGVGDPTPATRAELSVTVTATGSATLPAFSQLLGGSNGVVYLTAQAVDVSPGANTVLIRASTPGTVGNLGAGAAVSFVQPVPAVATDTTVQRQTVTGADAEAVEVYRQRVLQRFQRRAQGGALVDYQIWGEEVAGVVNVYPYTGDPGQVNVYVEAGNQPQGIPTQAQLNAVVRSINLDADGLATRRPADALVNARPITRTTFTVRVLGLVVDNLSATRSGIEAALLQYFEGREPFITGVSLPPRRDQLTQTAVTGVVDDIVSANSGVFGSVEVREGSTVITTRVLREGEKAARGAVTYV